MGEGCSVCGTWARESVEPHLAHHRTCPRVVAARAAIDAAAARPPFMTPFGLNKLPCSLRAAVADLMADYAAAAVAAGKVPEKEVFDVGPSQVPV